LKKHHVAEVHVINIYAHLIVSVYECSCTGYGYDSIDRARFRTFLRTPYRIICHGWKLNTSRLFLHDQATIMATSQQEQEMYDQMLMQLAGRHNGLENLLDTIFSFFNRKTDLYVVANKEQNNMGFPPGIAEKLVMRSFQKFPMKDISKMHVRGEQPNNTGEPRVVELEPPSPPTSVLKGVYRGNEKKTKSTNETDENDKKTETAPSPVASAGDSESSPTATSGSAKPIVRYNENGKQIPIGNGGVCDRYFWTQNLQEVTVYIDVPEGTRAKNIAWQISSTSIGVGLADGGNTTWLLKGSLGGRVKTDSMWTLEENKTIVITLDKIVETWWASVVKGDPEIDTQKVDSTRRVHEYDEETQGAIRKIMFDQQQKRMGLPTSDEMKQEAILAKARYAPGSPFLPENYSPPPGAAGGTE
jgi:hypothetical protein